MFMFPLVSPAATTVRSCEVELGPMRAAKPCRRAVGRPLMM